MDLLSGNGHRFPTSDEDSSTPDPVPLPRRCKDDARFPTSDEDSSTPDTATASETASVVPSFRPLTRIHLLLTLQTWGEVYDLLSFRPLTRIHLLLTCDEMSGK